MLVMISEYIPGPLRRLTLAVTEMVLPIGTNSSAAEGGYGCAGAGRMIAGATMMISVALSAFKGKGIGNPLLASRPHMVNGQC
jgi:hypothetical protein